jgi:hypothetical protein
MDHEKHEKHETQLDVSADYSTKWKRCARETFFPRRMKLGAVPCVEVPG